MMKKKILCTFVIAMLLLPASAFAGASDIPADVGSGQSLSGGTTATPYFAAVTSVTYALTFSGGNANCSIDVSVPQSKADSVNFQVTLHKKVGTSWQTVTSWNTNASVSSSNSASFYQSASVPSGNTYKFTSTTTVYKNGAVVDTVNYTTQERSN
jgi:hypothetical protein